MLTARLTRSPGTNEILEITFPAREVLDQSVPELHQLFIDSILAAAIHAFHNGKRESFKVAIPILDFSIVERGLESLPPVTECVIVSKAEYEQLKQDREIVDLFEREDRQLKKAMGFPLEDGFTVQASNGKFHTAPVFREAALAAARDDSPPPPPTPVPRIPSPLI